MKGKRPLDLLFLSTFRAPFIEEDLEILSQKFHVRPMVGHGAGYLLRVVFGVLRSEVVYCWFASVYASVAVMVARVFGVKSVIVLGGVDIARNKELRYGIWLSWWKSKFVRYALRHASRVLVSDLSMKQQAVTLARYSGANILLVPAGFDTEFWKPLGGKDDHILTVAAVKDRRTMRRKGIDVLIEAARLLPHVIFVVAGADAELVLENNPPANMTFHPFVPRRDLLPLYRRARIYCQPSVEEAFCYTLREAMLCGCIPVASDVGGMRTAASGIGIIIPPSNIEALVAGILRAMRMGSDVGEKARAHVVALYPKEKRETELCKIIEELSS